MQTTLPCPHCESPMDEVNARARSGYLLVLDQCAACGGIWCDRWELFPITANEASRLDAVDEEHLQHPQPVRTTTGHCPRCRVALRMFSDPVLPPDTQIERCPLCDGMWLNRGQLSRIKTPQIRDSPPPPAPDIEVLTRACDSEATWAQVRYLDDALHPVQNAPDEAEMRRELRSASGWLVLRILLRLLFRI